ncbi:MAG: hypothetical protein M3Y52_00425 [Actinomycetota bacterium]|nr:hypothetical protein [Actinomycetota bacterium]
MNTQRTATLRISSVSLIAAMALAGGLLTACSSTASAETISAATHSHSDHGNGDHASEHASEHAKKVKPASAETQLHATMRTLWDQHMAWTWSTVVAFADGSPGLDATVTRLLQNQADIGDAVAPFYGDEAAAELTTLLQTHITDAVPVLTAAKAGDTAALQAALDEWHANARDIADFLAGANPAWPQDDMRAMMATHIDQTTAYAAAVIGGDYASGIATFDEAQAHMVQMADELSAGLIAQFPKEF